MYACETYYTNNVGVREYIFPFSLNIPYYSKTTMQNKPLCKTTEISLYLSTISSANWYSIVTRLLNYGRGKAEKRKNGIRKSEQIQSYPSSTIRYYNFLLLIFPSTPISGLLQFTVALIPFWQGWWEDLCGERERKDAQAYRGRFYPGERESS